MALQWDDTLILGIEELDNQHKTIVENFVRLSDAIQADSGADVIEELSKFLFEYAQVHFATEDRYMVRYGYPDAEIQRREHSQFVRDANAFRLRMQEEGVSKDLAIALKGNLVRWIIQHIRNHDKAMYEYCLERIATEKNLDSAPTDKP